MGPTTPGRAARRRVGADLPVDRCIRGELLAPRPDRDDRVLATDGDVGVLTDRDLRTRVVAERRSSLTPIGDVMTPRAETVSVETMAGEVLLRMLEGGFHHFPVVDAAGTVVGVVTDTDLMGLGRNTPFALKSAIARAGDRDGVASAMSAPAPVQPEPTIVARPASTPTTIIDADGLVPYLGQPRFRKEVAFRTSRPGVATGVAWTEAGSDVLYIEATVLPGGQGQIVLTGQRTYCMVS